MLTRLGFLTPPTTRSDDELAVAYYLGRVAEAAWRASTAGRLTRTWRYGRLHAVHLEARWHTDLATNPDTQRTLAATMDSLFSEGDLVAWQASSPWVRTLAEKSADHLAEGSNHQRPPNQADSHPAHGTEKALTPPKAQPDGPGEITADIRLDWDVYRLYEADPQVSVNAVAKRLHIAWATADKRLRAVKDLVDEVRQGASPPSSRTV
ncbi:hypothetical protein [Nonomuraea typhae]|uniref:hypothetical protein n=1 Tax=Nonomuraea typhae TaxID=2603600 RepID=UPI0012F94927|nr:hypothetical protein [Nonomuraea typhae]